MSWPWPRGSRSPSRRSWSPTRVPGEAVVAVQACGVCHTDLHYREGGINDEFPFLLGHEAAGVVEAVGPGVTAVAPGDFVVLNWRAVCGECRSCRRGRPVVLLRHPQRHPEDDAGRRHAAVPRPRASAPSPRRPWWPPASAPRSTRPPGPRRSACWAAGSWPAWARPCSPARCGPGDSVAVFGCGGVGCAAVAGAGPGRGGHRHRRRPRRAASWPWPRSSAPPTPSTPRPTTRSRPSGRLTGGNGADVCIEAVGQPQVMEQAFYARDLAGTAGPGRRAHARHADRPAHDRVLRPRRRAQAELVRRLPAHRGTSRCWSTSTCRAASTSTASSPRPSRSTTSRRPSHRMERGEVLRSVVVL